MMRIYLASMAILAAFYICSAALGAVLKGMGALLQAANVTGKRQGRVEARSGGGGPGDGGRGGGLGGQGRVEARSGVRGGPGGGGRGGRLGGCGWGGRGSAERDGGAVTSG